MFEDSILATPGLYNGKIFATRADKSGIPEFELMTTLVIPYHFDADNNYSLNFEDIVLDPGLHKRYFLKIPYGTSNLNFRLSSSNNTFIS